MLERVVDTKTAPDVSSPLLRCIAVSIIVFTTSTPCMISCSPNLPLHILDAHLLTRFLIVVEPLAFLQIDAREQCSRLEPFCLPLPLRRVSQRTPMRSLVFSPTSALNSVNSRPRQSNSIMLTFCGGELCT